MSSSRRTSGHSEEAKVGVGVTHLNRSRTGSASSVRSGASTGSGRVKAVKAVQQATPPVAAADSNVSCHFRYTGCHLLVIVSDGCDMLRQEHLCAALKLNESTSGNPSPAILPPNDGQLKKLDSEWTRKFIEHAIQQIAKGK